jgi:predicted acyltransferase
MIAAGYLWGLQFPIIKAIWTSSFVLIVGGYSMILLAVSHQVIDVWEWKSWAMPFVWVGANAILLYFLNGIIGFAPLAFRVIGGDVALWISSVTTSGTGALLGHILGLAFAIALAGFLYHRKIFLRV